jgi:cytochrome c biogenesis protein
MSMLAYHGDLGMDSGQPQSVYQLDKRHLSLFKKPNGAPDRVDLAMGKTQQLPGGGSIKFDHVDRWVKLQVSNSPGKGIALGGVLAGIIGLLGSLFIRPRRAWVRVTRNGGRTVVELAGLDRSSGGNLGDEIDDLETRIKQEQREDE